MILHLDLPGNLLSEAYTAGPLAGLTISNRYDPLRRRTTNGLWNGSQWLAHTRYSYGADGRLQTVGDDTHSATYTHLANSPRVGQVTFTANGLTAMTTTRSYDPLNRLAGILSSNGPAGVVISHGYQYNAAHQRTRVTREDGSYWVYAYDALGQVTSARKYRADGTPVAGQQFEYAYDDIGNRQTAAGGGDQFGANLRMANYTANGLNQYVSRTVPGSRDVLGAAHGQATVTVLAEGGVAAPYPDSVAGIYPTGRQGDYFRGEVFFNNRTGAVWLELTTLAVLPNGSGPDLTTTNTGHLFVPQTPEVFTYDADGNLTTNGQWVLSWDGENRLVRLTPNTAVGPQGRIDFEYDWQGRRITKKVWNDATGTSGPKQSEKFLYDGWNLLAQLNATNNAVLRSFVWGSDLSGSLQGAGGVGGLLAMTVHQGANAGTYFYGYDGNGNVVALVSAADGTEAARYEYGPFGELLRGTGPVALVNPFRFSTKYQDDETGWLYYGYRYYDPSTGRWPNRDPLQEEGGANLYNFSLNNPLSGADLLGLKTIQLEFNAFIHANKGVAASTWFGTAINPTLTANGLTDLTWIDEPGGTLWITSTSGRGPGGGSSKVKTIVSSFDSRQIGRLRTLGITESTTSGTSHRIRRTWLGLGSGFVLQSKPGLIRSHSIKVKDINPCKSEIKIKASGEYPFNVGGGWGALVPNIDYEVTYTLERDTTGWVIVLDGTHNRFPDYEGRVSQYWIYHWAAPGTGPSIWNLNGWTSFFAGVAGQH